MKMLLDENLPKRLKNEFGSIEVLSVVDMGWNGKKNGELLALMMAENFNALITFDKNIQHQQNFLRYPIPIIVINASSNDFFTVSPFVPKIIKLVESGELKPGPNEIKE
ncbi:MAG: DUF5615 family PIN-like protein [Saprospiraceae bacterium]